MVAKLHRSALDSLFGVGISMDDKNSSQNVIKVGVEARLRCLGTDLFLILRRPVKLRYDYFKARTLL